MDNVPVPAPTRFSVKVIKEFTYRGNTKRWSNRYFWTGSNPTGTSAWETLMDAIVADEKICYGNSVTVVECVGYNAGSEIPVHTKTYSVAGTCSTTGATLATGDSCVLIRFSTDQRTSKNHPIYLFKYIHGALKATSDPGDNLLTLQYNHAGDFAAAEITGYSVDGTTRHLCGPRGAVALGYFVSPYIHHRDFVN
jgi:hypothetical protein